MDEAVEEAVRPTGMSEQAVVEPFIYSPILSNHATSNSESTASQGVPYSFEQPSTALASPAPASSSPGNDNHRPEAGESSLRNQVQMLMTELANVRAQQTLQQQGSGPYNRDGDDGVPPPDYISDGGMLGGGVENEAQQTQAVHGNGRKRLD